VGNDIILCESGALWVLEPVACACDHVQDVYDQSYLPQASAPRWTFKGGMRDAAREALVILQHEEDDQMEHS
jgi:hypothetical protein